MLLPRKPPSSHDSNISHVTRSGSFKHYSHPYHRDLPLRRRSTSSVSSSLSVCRAPLLSEPLRGLLRGLSFLELAPLALLALLALLLLLLLPLQPRPLLIHIGNNLPLPPPLSIYTYIYIYMCVYIRTCWLYTYYVS